MKIIFFAWVRFEPGTSKKLNDSLTLLLHRIFVPCGFDMVKRPVHLISDSCFNDVTIRTSSIWHSVSDLGSTHNTKLKANEIHVQKPRSVKRKGKRKVTLWVTWFHCSLTTLFIVLFIASFRIHCLSYN